MKVKTDTWMTLSFLGPLQDGAQGGQFSESPETFSFIKKILKEFVSLGGILNFCQLVLLPLYAFYN